MLSVSVTAALIALSPQHATHSQAQIAAAPKLEKPKLVCRQRKEVGSRIPARVCRTKQDWSASDRDERSGAERSMATRVRSTGDQ